MDSQVFDLPQLEILDLGQNTLNGVPDDIKKMRCLRVFAIQHNNVQDLPVGLAHINTLRVLKVFGNPLNYRLKRIVDNTDDVLSPSTSAPLTDGNEKVTRKLIEFLKMQGSGEEMGDGPLETPRAQSRFPIQPFKYGHSTSGSESASEQRSPIFMKATVPSRSHFRGPSFQSNGLQMSSSALRRPNLAPLAVNNERNRSNSESVLQATQHTKSKRMGMFPRKHTELGVLDEQRGNRNSHHFRGQSHGSALRNGFRPGESSDSEINNTAKNRDGTFVRRLSSIPEQKQGTTSTDKVIEGAKGILYSLHLIHPQIFTLMTLVKDPKGKRSSLQRVYQDASMHLDHLDQEIHRFNSTHRRSRRFDHGMKKTICKASSACVTAYQQVGTILLNNVTNFIKEGDQRYIRTLMLMLYGSMNEARNARQNLVSGMTFDSATTPSTATQQNLTIKRIAEQEALANHRDSITPTQGHPKPGSRWGNGSIEHRAFPPVGMPSQDIQPAIPTYVNGRSRSNSRAGGIYSSTSSSVASTPRSGESFASNLLTPRSRSGSVARDPKESFQSRVERDQFERIFLTLSKATDQGLSVIPLLESKFVSKMESCKRAYAPSHIQEMCSKLVVQTLKCMEVSRALKARLSVFKLNDSDARNAPDFWRLARAFATSWSDLMLACRQAKMHQLVENDVRHMLRPVYRTSVDAANLTHESIWDHLTNTAEGTGKELPSQPQSTIHSRAPTPILQPGPPPTLHIPPLPQPPPPTPVGMQPPSRSQSQSRNDSGFHRRAAGNKGSNGSNNGAGASPASLYAGTIPATPLSAALGPAAQVTVSSTPGGSGGGGSNGGGGAAGLNRSFEGDVFQRADYLQSTMRRFG